MPGTALELAVDELADNRYAIRPIERDGANVEDGGDQNGTAEADEIDENAERDVQPDCGERRVGALVDAVPVAG